MNELTRINNKLDKIDKKLDLLMRAMISIPFFIQAATVQDNGEWRETVTELKEIQKEIQKENKIENNNNPPDLKDGLS